MGVLPMNTYGRYARATTTNFPMISQDSRRRVDNRVTIESAGATPDVVVAAKLTDGKTPKLSLMKMGG